MIDYLRDLKNAPAQYRSTPFWSWNSKLEADELKRQIQMMKDAGIGGYIMHARGGLLTEYFSDDWFDVTAACIDEGKRQGMDVWFYDEKGWPSGFAGGAVAEVSEDFWLHWLEFVWLENGETYIGDGTLLSYYGVNEQKNTGRRIGAINLTEKDEKLAAVIFKTTPYYVDVLNKHCIARFLEHTYERYYSEFQDKLGQHVKGFFTDEPQYSRTMPWSVVFPAEFNNRYGGDILDNLILLFVPCKGYERFRYCYFNMANALYVESFAKQIGQWCDKHDLQLTGHCMLEDSLGVQMNGTAGVMPFYEYMQQPGIDWLMRRVSSPITPKQAGSVAAQLGKKFVLSETFALTGWDVKFSELKFIAEWQYLNGVNKMCQHLEGYTIKGYRKRDYPPSLFYQMPWWDEYRAFNDYFAGLGRLLSDGRQAEMALLIHPMKSAYIDYNGQPWCQEIHKIDLDFEAATTALSDHQIEHHYGDETILSRHGRVVGNRLCIGEMTYNIVFLPSMRTIDKSTIKLLDALMDNGGKVVRLGTAPEYLEGQLSEELEAFFRKIDFLSLDELENRFFAGISIKENGKDAMGIHVTKRLFDGYSIYFILNMTDQRRVTDITISDAESVGQLSILSGQICSLKQYKDKGKVILPETVFEPRQSMVLVCTGELSFTPYQPMETNTVKLDETWKLESFTDNIMVLDRCRYALNGSEMQQEITVSELFDQLLDQQYKGKLEMEFRVNIHEGTALQDISIALESAERFDIKINGQTLQKHGGKSWIDPCFMRYGIADLLQYGENRIALSIDYYQDSEVYRVLNNKADLMEAEKNMLTFDTELENIYILGSFGVFAEKPFVELEKNAIMTEGGFYLAPLSDRVDGKSLTQSGFAFFAGRLVLRQEINCPAAGRTILDLGAVIAPMLKLSVNHCEPIRVMWDGYIDITPYVHSGENTVTIELISGNRNLFGPFHLKEGESFAVSPYSFSKKAMGEKWSEHTQLVKFGIDPKSEQTVVPFGYVSMW